MSSSTPLPRVHPGSVGGSPVPHAVPTSQPAGLTTGRSERRKALKLPSSKRKKKDEVKPCSLANCLPWREHSPTLAVLLKDGSGDNNLLNGKLRPLEEVCSVCAASLPCNDAKGCTCVVGVGGGVHCSMHGAASSGGSAAAATATVQFNASGGCSNCKSGKVKRQSKARGNERAQRQQTSVEERQFRTSVGLTGVAPATLSAKRAQTITFALFGARAWDCMWYYWCKWGGAMDKERNAEKWGVRYSGLAERAHLVSLPLSRETSTQLAERMYAHISRHVDALLRYRISSQDCTLNWEPICSAEIDKWGGKH